jgi:uncharacterized protein (TIGR03000 family)
VKKFLTLAALGVTAAALTLATPAVSEAGWHYGRGHYHSYRSYGHRYYGHRSYGHRYWNRFNCYVAPTYYCPPAPPPCQDNVARIRVLVPAGARVWVDNQETTQLGTDRSFDSPPLTPGKEYTYNVTARWNCPDGKEAVKTRQVDVQANAAVSVDLTQPAS